VKIVKAVKTFEILVNLVIAGTLAEVEIQGAVRSRLKAMIEVGRMLKRRFENILTYLRPRVTNAASESINSKIQWVKYTARGFRSQQNFANAIYFHCGGLDLAPDCTK
jgi:hypothetical protein